MKLLPILTILIFGITLVVAKESDQDPEKREASISLALIITLILIFIDKFLTNKLNDWKKRYAWLSCIQSSLITVTIGILAGLTLNLV